MWLSIYILLIFLSSAFRLISTGSVLFLPPMISPSHKIPMKVWAKILNNRGHEIYWWAPTTRLDKYQPDPSEKIHVEHFLVTINDRALMDLFHYGNASLHKIYWNSEFISPSIETEFAFKTMPFCSSVIENHRESFQRVISRKYDLIVVDDILNPCGWVVAQMVRGPVVVFITSSTKTRLATKFNRVPVQYAVTPSLGDLFIPTDQMDFLERTRTALSWTYAYLADLYYYKLMTNDLRKLIPEASPIESGVLRPHMQFFSMSPFFDLVTPTVQNMIYVGGLQVPKLSQLKPLTDDYNSWINKAGSTGFVVLSFGHWVNWTTASVPLRTAFIESFKNIPNTYSVIWQYDGPVIPGLPDNIHLVKWLPLASLLADQKCKLFITHCGCNSLTEASTYGVPMLAIPLWADQPDGAARTVKRGFGVVLKKTRITTQTLSDAITEVLTNDSYSKNVKRFSMMQKTLPMDAQQMTIFWSEFLMRNHEKKDGVYYRTSKAAINMNLLQIHCMDILLFFITIFTLLCFIIVKIISFIKTCFEK